MSLTRNHGQLHINLLSRFFISLYLGNGKSKLQCFIDIFQVVFNMATLVPGVMGRFWNETPDGIVYLLIAAVLAVGLYCIVYLGQYALQHWIMLPIELRD